MRPFNPRGANVPVSPSDRGSFELKRLAELNGDVPAFVRKLQTLPFLRNVCVKQDVELPGIRGRVRSISGTTLTLWTPSDVRNFLPDALRLVPGASAMKKVEASSTDGTYGTKHAGAASIESVNETDGTVTATVPWTTAISSLVNDDYLFGENEHGPPVRQSELVWSGAVVRLIAPGRFSGAVSALSARGGFPILRTLEVAHVNAAQTVIVVESRYATAADLLIY